MRLLYPREDNGLNSAFWDRNFRAEDFTWVARGQNVSQILSLAVQDASSTYMGLLPK